MDLHEYLREVIKYTPEELKKLNEMKEISRRLAQFLPQGVTKFSSSTGLSHGLYIGSDGNLYGWGENITGQVGIRGERGVAMPTLVPLPEDVRPMEISVGDYHSMMIDAERNMYIWGNNAMCQLGNSSFRSRDTPAITELANGVKALTIIAGRQCSVAVGTDNKVYVWGNNLASVLAHGLPDIIPRPFALKM